MSGSSIRIPLPLMFVQPSSKFATGPASLKTFTQMTRCSFMYVCQYNEFKDSDMRSNPTDGVEHRNALPRTCQRPDARKELFQAAPPVGVCSRRCGSVRRVLLPAQLPKPSVAAMFMSRYLEVRLVRRLVLASACSTSLPGKQPHASALLSSSIVTDELPMSWEIATSHESTVTRFPWKRLGTCTCVVCRRVRVRFPSRHRCRKQHAHVQLPTFSPRFRGNVSPIAEATVRPNMFVPEVLPVLVTRLAGIPVAVAVFFKLGFSERGVTRTRPNGGCVRIFHGFA